MQVLVLLSARSIYITSDWIHSAHLKHVKYEIDCPISGGGASKEAIAAVQLKQQRWEETLENDESAWETLMQK